MPGFALVVLGLASTVAVFAWLVDRADRPRLPRQWWKP